MNKLLLGVTLSIAASITATSVLAASNSKIIITTENKSTTLPYNVASGVTAEIPVDSDILSLSSTNSTTEYSEKAFSITSTRGNINAVDIKLVFTSEADEELEYSALDYYDIKLADGNGDYIYDCDNDQTTGQTRNEIDLGTFNSQFSDETKDYTIYYKINPDAAEVMDKADAAKLKLIIESTEITNTISAVSPATVAPSVPTSAPEETATAAASTEAPTATAEAVELSEKTYVCGKDIDPGRYLVDGNANITIKDKSGKLLKEVVVSDGSLGDFGGVDKFLVSLEEGDTITVGALTPDTKAVVNFKSASAKASATPSPSQKAVAAAKSNSSSKTNPKTGDNSTAIPAIVAAMAMSAGFIGILEILKRKNFSAD